MRPHGAFSVSVSLRLGFQLHVETRRFAAADLDVGEVADESGLRI